LSSAIDDIFSLKQGFFTGKPNFPEIPAVTEATTTPGLTDPNVYMTTLMDIYNLSVSSGCHELMDLSDFNSIGEMVHHGLMPLPPQNDVLLPFYSSFAQPTDQKMMVSVNWSGFTDRMIDWLIDLSVHLFIDWFIG
jgi:hypothetical protein